MNVRDENILRHMLDWCVQASEAHEQYRYSREAFDSISAYRNALSMCIFQICELANHLSEAFRLGHPEIPWQQIRGMRNLFAHDYGNMNTGSIWATANNDIPGIEQFCRIQLGMEDRKDQA